MTTKSERGWQPIETAPRDGTPIVAKIPYNGSDNVIAWVNDLVDSCDQPCGSWMFIEEQEPPPCWTDGYCWESNENGEPSVQPTHWMPLRAPALSLAKGDTE